jgi:hypothetical protein
MTLTAKPLTAGRLCLFVAFVLFVAAALASFGVVKADVAAIALLGFAFWALAGAV